MRKLIFTLVGALLLTGPASADIVVDGGGSNFGATAGVGVQFDASPVPASASGNIAVSELVDGGTFSVDSITLSAAANNLVFDNPLFLGAYTSVGPADGTDPTIVPVSGFQGISNESVTFSGLTAGDDFTFTFSGLNVTSNADITDLSDQLFFLFQEGTDPLTQLPSIPNNQTGIDRLANNADVDSRVQIIQVPNSGAVVFRADRAPSINVGVTQIAAQVPEPSSLALLGLSSVFAFARRRRS